MKPSQYCKSLFDSCEQLEKGSTQGLKTCNISASDKSCKALDANVESCEAYMKLYELVLKHNPGPKIDCSTCVN